MGGAILSDWKRDIGHDCALKVCGVCGKMGLSNEFERVEFDDVYVGKFKLNEDETRPDPSLFHIFEHNQQNYRLVSKGIEIDQGDLLINLCFDCTCITRTEKIPIHSIAIGDLGKVPEFLPSLSLVEKMCIRRYAIFENIIKLKLISGCTESQNALFGGHVLAVSLKGTQDVKKTCVSFPRKDLSQLINVMYMGSGETFKMVKKLISKEGPLQADFSKCLQWLKFLKKHNPDYQNVELPETANEITKAQEILNVQVDTICANATISEGSLPRAVELSNTSDVTQPKTTQGVGKNKYCELGRSLITSLPEVDEPTKEILSDLADKVLIPNGDQPVSPNSSVRHEITFSKDLANEYQENPKILSN